MTSDGRKVQKRAHILGDVITERKRQEDQGKQDHQPALWWYMILSYQMNMLSMEFMHALYEDKSLATKPGSLDVEIDHNALRQGLVRVMAVALAWLEDEE
jgi:hypothetical protein